MKSAEMMSRLIREKKKKMLLDPDVIDAGGSPREDLQDLEIARQNETAIQNDHNTPKERSMGLDLSNAAEDAQEEEAQSNHKDDNANHRDDESELTKRHMRKSRISKMMSK